MLNLTAITGRLTRLPELIYTPSKTAICTLSVATNESYTNSAGERVDETQFHTVRAFGKQAEACAKFLVIGQEVTVTGSMTYRTYDDERFKDDDGKACRRTLSRILAQRVTFGPKPRGSSNNQSANDADREAKAEDYTAAAEVLGDNRDNEVTKNEDLPF